MLLILGLLLAGSPGVEAILKAHCYACHGATPEPERGINVLDLPALIEMGIVEPGNPKSALLRVVESGRMPLKGKKLTRKEIDVLRRWVLEMGKAGPVRPGPVIPHEHANAPRS